MVDALRCCTLVFYLIVINVSTAIKEKEKYIPASEPISFVKCYVSGDGGDSSRYVCPSRLIEMVNASCERTRCRCSCQFNHKLFLIH